MTFNKNIDKIKPSRSMVIMQKANELKKVDSEIVDLAGGEPDFDTPARITMEMIKHVSDGYTHYTVGPGLPELRKRIAQKLRVENHCHYTSDEIIVTPGGKYAIYMAAATLLNEGDEAIYLNPGWVSYPSIIEAVGARSVPVNLDYENQYAITLDKLEEKYSEKTKLLIINYPNNPTGRILHPEEMRVIKQFLSAHEDIWLISDEMYERITFDQANNISPASDEELKNRIITINGFSKSVAMTGWRMGYLAGSMEFVKRANKLFQHTISCVSGFIQKAGIVALDCVNEIEFMRQTYEERRNFFINALNEIPGVECRIPEGAFYAWVKFDIPGMDSEEICRYVLEEGKVVGVPGISYGEEEIVAMRFSFANSMENLTKAASQLNAALKKLRGEK